MLDRCQKDPTMFAERIARQEAERLTQSELPGVVRVLAKDLRPGQVVLSESGLVDGVVTRVDKARKLRHVVVSWTDGTQWIGSELQIYRVDTNVRRAQ